jgi:hypothetical protein
VQLLHAPILVAAAAVHGNDFLAGDGIAAHAVCIIESK